MAEHDELVAEMPILEQMGTQERQKLAKKRRLQQLKKWGQREKEWIAKEKQLNKRLASIINEENNGLNLKQYTTYGSNQRTKKRLANNTLSNSGINNNNNNNSNKFSTNVKKELQYINNNNISSNIDGPYASRHEKNLAPNGRVHFDVGVMLLEAAARNDFDEVKRLLSLGVSPDSVNHDGLTALHQCCIDASEPMMNLLLEFGANVDARDTEKWTPLHAACTCGHLNLVKILVEYDADLLAVNGDGNMPFDICEDEETLNFIESQMVKRGITQEMIDLTRASAEMQMLSELEKRVSEGGDLNEADDNGVTYLHTAAANNYLSAVKFMLKHGVNVNVCDNDLWRPLHGVACWGNEQHIKIAELLVGAGASMDAKTINDETVFDLCDNVDLLEKLNQLKNELENKQASGADRLRRTQSRTNSRVHSVRRTSVRDKNQISRREAREEALLRVEGDTTPNSAPDQADRPLPSHQSVDQNEKSSIETASQPQESTQLPVDVTSSGEHVDSGTVLANVSSSFQNSLGKSNGVGQQENSQRSQSSGSELAQSFSNDKHNQTNSTTTTKQVSAPDACNVNQVSEQQLRLTGTKLISLDVTDSSSDYQAAKMTTTATTAKIQAANGKGVVVAIGNNEHNHDDRNLDINQDLICDQTMRSISQTTTVQVQFTPINYTLSNLKKHRSDLRMRTINIGGNVSTSNINGYVSGSNNHQVAATNTVAPSPTSGSAPTVAAPAAAVVHLDPEPSKLMVANGGGQTHVVGRPGSPSLTFRKFHGEPSEVIGDAGRKNQHKCCTII